MGTRLGCGMRPCRCLGFRSECRIDGRGRSDCVGCRFVVVVGDGGGGSGGSGDGGRRLSQRCMEKGFGRLLELSCRRRARSRCLCLRRGWRRLDCCFRVRRTWVLGD